jgi:hypothetical protein
MSFAVRSFTSLAKEGCAEAEKKKDSSKISLSDSRKILAALLAVF